MKKIAAEFIIYGDYDDIEASVKTTKTIANQEVPDKLTSFDIVTIVSLLLKHVIKEVSENEEEAKENIEEICYITRDILEKTVEIPKKENSDG